MQTHTNERPSVCTVGGKDFRRQNDRKRCEALHPGGIEKGQKRQRTGKVSLSSTGTKIAVFSNAFEDSRRETSAAESVIEIDVPAPYPNTTESSPATQKTVPQPTTEGYTTDFIREHTAESVLPNGCHDMSVTFDANGNCLVLPAAMLAQYPDLATKWPKLHLRDFMRVD
jgi:hypothetical protein